MADEMSIEDYLAQGGRLTGPANVPARYRGELMKIMATLVDSELAGAAGFAEIINESPGIEARSAAARIVLEKTEHAGRVLRLMGDFGADTARYARHHPWNDRLARDTPPGAARSRHDMRLPVLNYPLEGWADAVAMHLLMGLAVTEQLGEYTGSSYQPFAEAVREIVPRERHHAELAEEGIARLVAEGETEQLRDSIAYWWPRVAGSFGAAESPRTEALVAMGLRKTSNAALRDRWAARAGAALEKLGLEAPAAI